MNLNHSYASLSQTLCFVYITELTAKNMCVFEIKVSVFSCSTVMFYFDLSHLYVIFHLHQCNMHFSLSAG